jgi:hypothetical protein
MPALIKRSRMHDAQVKRQFNRGIEHQLIAAKIGVFKPWQFGWQNEGNENDLTM